MTTRLSYRSLVALVLLLVGCASLHPAERAALWGQGADVLTTAYAVQQPGLREGNPMLGSPEGAVLGAALKVAYLWLVHRAVERHAERLDERAAEEFRARVWRRVALVSWAGPVWNGVQIAEADGQ